MRVLGIHAFTHNASAALVADGRLAAFAEEERSSRVKSDASFPAGAIAACLAEGGLSPADVDRVSFPFRPSVGAARRLAYLAFKPSSAAGRLLDLARKGSRVWSLEARLRELGIRAPVTREDHYACHALAVFLSSPFAEASVLVLDGVAEAWSGACYRAVRFPSPRLETVARFPFPHSLGLVYAAVTEHLGFGHNREEGKVMSMAALGDARFDGSFPGLCEARGLSLRVDRGLFDFGGTWTTPRFHRRFGPPRRPGEPFIPEHFALARCVQDAARRAAQEIASNLVRRTRFEDLCFTGGLALNPALNARLAEHSGCRGFFALPAGGDAGAALGAALAGKADPAWRLEHAFWGRGWREKEARDAARDAGGRVVAEGPEALDRAAGLLANGAVGAVFRGRSEMGPRALGHRSILADPRSESARDRLNDRVKEREFFQPFAPAVLASACPHLFPRARVSPFMLLTVAVPPDVQERIPAVVHLDGTARVQVVEEGDASGLSGLLAAFERRAGLPVLLNTSLNRKGEPMADSPNDAVETFREAGLDFLLMEDTLVVREGAP